MFNLSIKYNESDPQQYFLFGEFYDEQEQYQKAEEMYKLCIKYQEDHTDSYIKLGKIYQKVYKDLEKAEINYKLAIKYKEYYSNYYLQLGQLYNVDFKDIEKAKETFQKSLKYQYNNYYSYIWLAQVAISENQLEKSKEYCLKSIKYKNKNPKAYFILGNYYYQIQDYENSEKYYKISQELDPQQLYIYDYLVALYKKLKQTQKTIDTYLKWLELDKNNENIYKNLGQFYLKQKQYEKSEEMYINTIKLKNKNPKVYLSLGKLQLKNLKKYEQAEINLQKAAQQKQYTAYQVLAYLYSEILNEPKRSEQMLLLFLEQNQEDAETYLLLSNLYKEKLNQPEKSLEYLEKAQQFQLQQDNQNNILNNIVNERKNEQKQQQNNNPFITQAQFQTLLNNFEGAIQILQQSIDQQEFTLETFEILGYCYQKLNQYELSKEYYVLSKPLKQKQQYIIELEQLYKLGKINQNLLNQPEKAINYYERFIEEIQKYKDKFSYQTSTDGLKSNYKRKNFQEYYFYINMNMQQIPQAYLQLSLLYQNHLNQPEKSEEYYLKTIQQKKYFPEAYQNLAELQLKQLNKKEEAQQNYKFSCNQNNENFECFIKFLEIKQILLEQQQNQEEKKQLVENFAKEYPESLHLTAQLYSILKLYKEQENCYIQAIQNQKANFYTYFLLAKVQIQQQQPEKAVENFLTCTYLKKDFIDAYFEIYDIYEEMGKPIKKQMFYWNIAILLYIQQQLKVQQNQETKFLKTEDFINENFEDIEQIGDGSYGSVVKVQDINTKKYYAKKIVEFQYQEVEFYLREQENFLLLQDQMQDEGTTKVKYFAQTEDNLTIIMELASGSLTDFIQKKEPIEPKVIYKIINDVLQGLQLLFFQNMIHRDIKPDNILYFQEDQSFKITDFGSSRVLLKEQKDDQYIINEIKKNANIDNKSITIIGTEYYFSPELYKAEQEEQEDEDRVNFDTVDWFANDIYGAGLSFFNTVCQVEMDDELQQNHRLIEEKLQQRENQNIYNPLLFVILRKMLIQEQSQRGKINELFLLSQNLQ